MQPACVIPSDKHVFTLSASNPPAASCSIGDVVVFDALDCYANRAPLDSPRLDLDRARSGPANPATGPLFVKGVEPGDMLLVEILAIDVAAKGHVSGYVLELKEGAAKLFGRYDIPLSPMIGVVGVAPKDADIGTTTTGDTGGNLDAVCVCAGAVVALPVQVPGALLAMGDVHAAQGDGEICGQGIEVAAKITVRLGRLRPGASEAILVKHNGTLSVLASAPTLDEAASLATQRAADIVARAQALSERDASTLIALVGDLRICQVVNPVRTVRYDFPADLVVSVFPA